MNPSIVFLSELFIWIFLMILIYILFEQTKGAWKGEQILRKRLEVQEAFQMPAKVVESSEVLKAGLSPGASELDMPARPYTILNDWLKPKMKGEMSGPDWRVEPKPLELIPDSTYGKSVEDIYKETGVQPRIGYTAQRCYESDFQTRLEITGNYRQMTNNYRRGDPDSCSAPNQDVALGFYKIDAVPFDSNCISRKEWPMQKIQE